MGEDVLTKTIKSTGVSFSSEKRAKTCEAVFQSANTTPPFNYTFLFLCAERGKMITDVRYQPVGV